MLKYTEHFPLEKKKTYRISICHRFLFLVLLKCDRDLTSLQLQYVLSYSPRLTYTAQFLTWKNYDHESCLFIMVDALWGVSFFNTTYVIYNDGRYLILL